MKSVKIAENIWWVGAVDYDVRVFHGYKTPVGTTYNAYLVIDEKISLIDSVKAPFSDTLLENIREIIDPAKIDYLIANHVEPDHSGAFPLLCEICPNAEIIATHNGVRELDAYYGHMEGMKYRVVKAGDSLCTGKFNFKFMPIPMIHWPDSMATYLEEEKILFPNDAMGQHIASPERFDDEIGESILLDRAADYYANIVLPFGMQVKKLLGELADIEIRMLCPSHGVILRSFLPAMADAYSRWADNVTKERAVIVYDTMWGATRKLAERLAAELYADGIPTRLINMSFSHVSEAMAYLLEAKYVYVGSPTLNRNIMPTVAAFLAYMKGLSPKNRVGRAFGAYGWSGESVEIIEETLKALGFELLDSVKCNWSV